VAAWIQAETPVVGEQWKQACGLVAAHGVQTG